MTVLEELIDIAMGACEKGRQAGQRQHARGAALLCADGRVFSGCDVAHHENDTLAVSAERGAALAAVSDGTNKFECMVVASETMESFPTPDGQVPSYRLDLCTVNNTCYSLESSCRTSETSPSF